MVDLRKKLAQSGKTPYSVSKEIGVRFQDVYHFISGRKDKIGRSNSNKIRHHFISIGFLPTPKRKVPQCRTCGTPYPTRKEVPVRAAVMSGSAESNSAGRQGNLPEQSNNLHEPAQLQTDKNILSSK
ncbi:MAG: hypothetical protein JXB49_31340 [Bacteroidales bacterium]|nr:hypothetical protein [Bacteroidales bacterium]